MQYLELQPNSELRKFIDCIWINRFDKTFRETTEMVVPDGYSEMIFSLGRGYLRVDSTGSKVQDVAGSHIVGFKTNKCYAVILPKMNMIGVRFKPGMLFPFTGIPANEFTQNCLPLEDIFGTNIQLFEQRLAALDSVEERVSAIQSFLSRQYKCDERSLNEIRAITEDIKINSGSETVSNVSARYGLNYKSLQRKFHKYVGTTPKQFSTITRFSNSLGIAKAFPAMSYTEVALNAGYCDQSHYIREFRKITGHAPREFFKQPSLICKQIGEILAAKITAPV